MKKLIMLFLMVLATLGFAADAYTPKGALSVPGGRYAFGQLNDYAASSYMLDTQTGRLWHVMQDEHTNLILVPVLYKMAGGGLILQPMDAQAEFEATRAAIKTNSIEQKSTYEKKPADELKPMDDPKK
jgi:hypothetical protein